MFQAFGFSQNIQLSLAILVITFSISACDQKNQSSNIKNEKKLEIEKVETTKENDTFTLEALEQQLKPLKEEIKRLENELAESQKLQQSSLEKIEDKQWNTSKLKETISILKEDKQDLKSQIKEHLAEIQVLQSALSKANLDCQNDNTKP